MHVTHIALSTLLILVFPFFLVAMRRFRKVAVDLEILTSGKIGPLPRLQVYVETDRRLQSVESAALLARARSTYPKFILLFRALAGLLFISAIVVLFE